MPIVQYNSRTIPVKSVQVSMREQNAPPVRQGPAARTDRQGVRQYKIQSLHKGFGIIRGSEINDNLRYQSSQGLIAHQPFGLFLPYVSTTQSDIASTVTIPSGVIIAWPSTNASIPSGWTRVTALDDKYTKGVATAATEPGTTGGATTHTHTETHTHAIDHGHSSNGNTGTSSGTFNGGNGSAATADDTHTHSIPAINSASVNSSSTGPTTGTGSNDPTHFTVVWIQSNGTPLGIPNGALTFADLSSTPSGWELYSSTLNRFLKGAAAAGDGGTSSGANTHNHTGGSHTHTSAHTHSSVTSGTPSATENEGSPGSGQMATSTHTHSITVNSGNFGTSGSADVATSTDAAQPPYYQLPIFRNTSGGVDLPNRVIVIWRGTIANIPSGWIICDGNNNTPNLLGKYLKGVNVLGDRGTTGGATTHSHASDSHTHTWTTAHTHTLSADATSGTANTDDSGSLSSSADHTHSDGTSSSSSPSVGTSSAGTSTDNNEPPYEEVVYLMGGASDDISSMRASNLRIHSVNSTLGQSKPRFYMGLGHKLYRNVSDSNSAMEDSGLLLIDNVTGLFEGQFNSTRYLALTTDGISNDCVGISDPTTSPPTRTSLFALTSGDWLGGGFYLPTLGPGYNIFYGKIGGVSGLWYLAKDSALLTAPSPLVLKATKDVEGTLATTVVGPQNPSKGASGTSTVYTQYTTGVDSRWDTWSSPGNITTSDNSKTTATFTNGSIDTTDGPSGIDKNLVSPDLYALEYDFSAIPPANIITDIAISIENIEGDAGDNFSLSKVRLMLNGSEFGPNLADRTEPPTTDTAKTFSGRLGVGELTGEQVRYGLGVVVQYQASDNSGSVSIDHITLTLTHRPPGTQAYIPLGGYMVGSDPSDPFSFYVVAPEFQDETSSVSVPRILWKMTLEYDAEGQRPVVTVEKINTGLNHVECACFALAGVVVAGDTREGIAKRAVLIRQDGSLVDLAFNSIGQGYTEDWGIVSVWGQGRILIADVALSAATAVQSWLYFDASWHAIGTRETITALPIAWAENPQICTELLRRYRVHPSSGNTTITRVFQPRSYFLDPLHNDTTEVKADGVLTITLPDLDMLGPEEAEKVLLKAWCLSRDVSASNTIRLRYSTDGGSTFTTWTTFTSFGSSSTLSTPVSFRTLVIEIGLNHTASSANTPNGLPILIEGAVRWTPQRQWECEIDPTDAQFLERFPGGIEELWDMLAGFDAVEYLDVGVDSVPCTWTMYQVSYTPGEQPKVLPDSKAPSRGVRHMIRFEEVVS